MPDLSAKVFRTYNASITLEQELEKEEFKGSDPTPKVKYYDKANREVALLCNHQKGVPKTFDETTKKQEAKLEEKEKKIKALKKQA